MPSLRIVMPDGTTRSFREGTPQSVIRKAQADMLAEMKDGGGYEGVDFDTPRQARAVLTQADAPLVPRARPEAPPLSSASRNWIWPVPGQPDLNPGNPAVSEGRGAFGTPRRGRNGNMTTHAGIDITAPGGTPVISPAAGKVVAIGSDPNGYGTHITIDHGDGFNTHYAHLNAVAVSVGDLVTPRQYIGQVGRTGNTPKNGRTHLDFEVRTGGPKARSQGGTVIDPLGPEINWEGRY